MSEITFNKPIKIRAYQSFKFEILSYFASLYQKNIKMSDKNVFCLSYCQKRLRLFFTFLSRLRQKLFIFINPLF